MPSEVTDPDRICACEQRALQDATCRRALVDRLVGAIVRSQIDPATLVFPSYDGNRRYLSLGSVAASGRSGRLLLDLETPHRLRAPLEATFVDSGRFLHRDRQVFPSRSVAEVKGDRPQPSRTTPGLEAQRRLARRVAGQAPRTCAAGGWRDHQEGPHRAPAGRRPMSTTRATQRGDTRFRRAAETTDRTILEARP